MPILLFDKLSENLNMEQIEGKDIASIRRDNLRKLVQKSGGPASFAKKVDMELSQLSQIIGPNPSRNIGSRLARKIEKSVGLIYGDLDAVEIAPQIKSGRIVREIPVVGTTQGGPDRHWEELGYPVGFGGEYIEHNSPDPHAYVLAVRGNSMAPKISEGEYVLVEPSLLAMPGDYVIAKLKSGEVLTKIFRSDFESEIILESFNHGYSPMIVKKSEIDFIHPVAAIFMKRSVRKRI
ncbi:MAG: S24 family peptidase [Leptospirillum sp.]